VIFCRQTGHGRRWQVPALVFGPAKKLRGPRGRSASFFSVHHRGGVATTGVACSTCPVLARRDRRARGPPAAGTFFCGLNPLRARWSSGPWLKRSGMPSDRISDLAPTQGRSVCATYRSPLPQDPESRPTQISRRTSAGEPERFRCCSEPASPAAPITAGLHRPPIRSVPYRLFISSRNQPSFEGGPGRGSRCPECQGTRTDLA